MKKDVYFFIGIAALVLTAAIGGTWWYKRSQRAAQESVVDTHQQLLVKDYSPSLGSPTARVTLVEFLDPECESCRAMHPHVKAILKEYGDRIHYVARFLPLHKNSASAIAWLEAAHKQGKLWESLDLLFERQPEWADHFAPKPELVPVMLESLGLNRAQLERDAADPAIKEHLRQARLDAQTLELQGTPTFFVNGRMVEELGEKPLRARIDEALSGR